MKESRLSHIELVIVGIALSMVSIQVVPKFTQASEDSKTAELIEGLQRMRIQLTLYHAENENSWPSTDSFKSFEATMTTRTGQRGPYMRKIPVNPYNGLNTVRFDAEPAGANKAGWRFETETGLFQADNGVRHAAI